MSIANRHPAMPDYGITEADCEETPDAWVPLGPDPWGDPPPKPRECPSIPLDPPF